MGFKITVELVVRWRQGGTETTTRPLYFFNPKIGQNVVLSKNCGMKPRKEEFTFLGSPRCPPPTSPPVGLPWKVGGGLPLTWQVGGGVVAAPFSAWQSFPPAGWALGSLRDPLFSMSSTTVSEKPLFCKAAGRRPRPRPRPRRQQGHTTQGGILHTFWIKLKKC